MELEKHFKTSTAHHGAVPYLALKVNIFCNLNLQAMFAYSLNATDASEMYRATCHTLCPLH